LNYHRLMMKVYHRIKACSTPWNINANLKRWPPYIMNFQ